MHGGVLAAFYVAEVKHPTAGHSPASLSAPCSASLAVGAAPSLAAAGASLAAAFLEKGLDGGDAAVLQRLMGLLAAPLAQWGAAAQVRGTWVQGGDFSWASTVLRQVAAAAVGLAMLMLHAVEACPPILWLTCATNLAPCPPHRRRTSRMPSGWACGREWPC